MFVYISIRLQRGASIEAMFVVVVDFIVVMLEYGEITYEDLRLRSHLQL